MKSWAAVALVASLIAPSASGQTARRGRAPAWVRMSATAYCKDGTTDSGAPTRDGVVAADPQHIPLGSTIRVRGLKGAADGVYTVLDTGRDIKGREIDLFIADCAAAKAFGRQDVSVRIVKRGHIRPAAVRAER